ncbi:MAG: transposase [Planctomycetes bacterium]|nr:transposase [Planctomycetota bacterium]
MSRFRSPKCSAAPRGWRRTAFFVAHKGRRYVIQQAVKGTDLAKAQCGTIRLKLLKIGAQIRVTPRKVWLSLAESYPYQSVFRQAYERLRRICPRPLRR